MGERRGLVLSGSGILLFGRQVFFLCHWGETERAQPVEFRGEDARLARREEVASVVVARQGANAVKRITSVSRDGLAKLRHLVLNALDGFGVTDVVGFHVGLRQERVVHLELWIEANGTFRGNKQPVCLVEMCRYVISDEASEIGDYDAVVVEQQYL